MILFPILMCIKKWWKPIVVHLFTWKQNVASDKYKFAYYKASVRMLFDSYDRHRGNKFPPYLYAHDIHSVFYAIKEPIHAQSQISCCCG
jgi:hypothetical protein